MKEGRRGCGSHNKPRKVVKDQLYEPCGLVNITQEPKVLTFATEAVQYNDRAQLRGATPAMAREAEVVR